MALKNVIDPALAGPQLERWFASRHSAWAGVRVTGMDIPSANGMSSETVLFDVSWTEDRAPRHQIAARLHLERKLRSQPLDHLCELKCPAGRKRKNIVGKPEVIGAKLVLELTHLCRDQRRRTYGEGIAVNRLRAPVAAVGATSAGDNVQREITVCAHPDFAIPRDIGKIPGWRRK